MMQNSRWQSSYWPLGFDTCPALEIPRPQRRWWFVAGFCLALAISAVRPVRAQETESVGDAARAFHARRAAQANQDTAHPAQPPLSATTLVTWQIAGIRVPDILNELQTPGITFGVDNSPQDLLKQARVAHELLAALPNVPSHLDVSSSSE